MCMKSKKEFIVNFVYLLCWIGIIYAGFTYLLPILLPFVFGFLFTVASRKITKNKNTIVLIAMYAVLGVLLVFTGIWLVGKIGGFVTNIPTLYRNVLKPFIDEAYNSLISLNLPVNFPYINDIITSGLSAIRNALLSAGSSAAGAISKVILEIPSLLFSILIFVISSFFFTADYDHVIMVVDKYCGTLFTFIREKLAKVLSGYVLIIGITFVELTIGLMILGVSYFPLIAAGTALLDILPILGCGTVLIPWAVLSLIQKKIGLGVGLLVLHVIIYLVRQYIEPKIVASNLEIPPILSLLSMVVGLRMFGFAGMLGMPLLASYFIYTHPHFLEEEKASSEVQK